jgi:catechol 2,3-dioxygenase-like lactoylglutathione lyase family enzyme
MSRVQLALNVSDLDTAADFYTAMFGAGPAKLRPGYANFAVADPPLKLVLIETGDGRGHGIRGALNHVGVEVDSAEDVNRTGTVLVERGLTAAEERATTCCYAVQDKVWASDPDQMPWEVYAVLADAPLDAGSCGDATSRCCQLQEAAASAGPCC